MKNRHNGLTLVEALVTLAILGVLAMVAAPGLSSFMEAQQVDSDTNDLFTSLLLARSEAVTRNSMVNICKINPATPDACNNGESWQSGWLTYADTDADGVLDADEDILTTFLGMGDQTTVTASNYANLVSYRPSGAVTTNGSFTICVNGNVANSIIINATGRPRVADATCP